jgi:CHAT domain-containing protein
MGFTPHADPVERYLLVSEAEAIAENFDAAPLLDAAATGAAIREQAPQACLVHLACHGRFDRNDPLASGVLLADGLFAGREWMRLRLRAELVTLSACETGFSRVSRGDEIASLSRVMLSAGAVSVLLTLWEVYSETTREWMLDFYDAAWDADGRPGQPKAMAFQHATLALRKRYPDPVYWAPFVLAGGWR